MNGKISSNISPEGGLSAHLLNPFVHHLELETTYEKIKIALFTVFLLPIRVAVICVLLTTAWLLACIGLWGVTEDDLRNKPLPITGWRRLNRMVISQLTLWMYMTAGVRLSIKGQQMPRKDAPLLILAPHSSFMDSVAVTALGGPSIVTKEENLHIPLVGKLINYTQAVYVRREDPNSRQNTIKEIVDRARSKDDWPQILIFPEGTCTNRSCLITFKPGAFYPGVPIQPVCIRYPNKLDTVTWTWEGPGALKLLWLTLTQAYSSCEIEFLPVYNPSEAEKRDPKLFANNVRNVMAKALGIPVSDYTYDDCRLMTRAKELHLPGAANLIEVKKIRQKLGLDQTNMEQKIVESHLLCNGCCMLNLRQFAEYLNVSENDVFLLQLFKLYDQKTNGVIDFREYLLGVLGLMNSNCTLETLELACKIYDSSGHGRLKPTEFSLVLYHTLGMTRNECLEIFDQIDISNMGYITFGEFRMFAEKKAEFAGLFSLSQEEKERRNGDISSSEYKKID